MPTTVKEKLSILIHHIFSPTIDNFAVWKAIVMGEDSSTELFWLELEFFSPSEEDPANFFEWYRDMP